MSKLKNIISKALGIKEWKLNSEDKLDITEEELVNMKAQYGEEFVTKFEQLLKEEAKADPQTPQGGLKESTKHKKSDMLKLELLCALLAVEAIALSEDGNATLTKEQLGNIEAGLRKLQDEKTAAESNLTTANSAKETAESTLSTAVTAMDDLDATIKAATTPAAKVEAIRKKLAEKPGAAASGTQTQGDQSKKKIEGADPVTEYAKTVIN
jgi:hypothetical protein